MTDSNLRGLSVAILVADGFEQVELLEPRDALQKAGAHAVLVSPAEGRVRGWDKTDWGQSVAVDAPLDKTDPRQFDALLLPGGVHSPDTLRMQTEAVAFVKAFVDAGKPIAAICHGPWTLIEAGGVKGRTMTSWPSLHTDLVNAGATWVDRAVVVDGTLVTSRNPGDIPAFNREMLSLFGQHVGQAKKAA